MAVALAKMKSTTHASRVSDVDLMMMEWSPDHYRNVTVAGPSAANDVSNDGQCNVAVLNVSLMTWHLI